LPEALNIQSSPLPPCFAEFDQGVAEPLLKATLDGCDDGELFLESRESEAVVFDDGRLKSASYSADQGFGLRVVNGEASGFAHAASFGLDSLKRACEAVSLARQSLSLNQRFDVTPLGTNQSSPYEVIDTMGAIDFPTKVNLLKEIDDYARSAEPNVVQVSASFIVERRVIAILRPDQAPILDDRPLVRLNVSVSVEHNGRRETAGQGAGGRYSPLRLSEAGFWKPMIDEAIRQAKVNLTAIEAPAGTLDVVLGNGWPGVLLHEAVGHGLEGDFNRKGSSAFSGKMGQQVAAKGVNVIDNGTIAEARGSLFVDDEGTQTQENLLIEDGILRGYMHDRQSARLMKTNPTGNGRRESFAHPPMPRMTNTYLISNSGFATTSRDDMIKNTKKGLLALNFGGGQVDITNGKFVFQCTEAYLIEDGHITHPVKGASLIGDGPEAMKRIDAIGSDFSLDPGVGTCGKAGQGVPVGIGQPSLRVRGLTVGGTA
jgi:TldD protein